MTEMGCGGAEMQVLALAREMRRRDHEVVVLALQDERHAIAEVCRVRKSVPLPRPKQTL